MSGSPKILAAYGSSSDSADHHVDNRFWKLRPLCRHDEGCDSEPLPSSPNRRYQPRDPSVLDPGRRVHDRSVRPFLSSPNHSRRVVDPGVGSERKPILAEAAGQLFIAPDNGVLSLILQEHEPSVVRVISNRKLWLQSPSQTFHGRDLFAPAAALIAAGEVTSAEVGAILGNVKRLPNLTPDSLAPNCWSGLVLHIDNFGNVITNFPSGHFRSINTCSISYKSQEIKQFYPFFGLGPERTLFAYHGSSGYIEIGINQQSAADALGIRPGDSITLNI